jgi:flavin reductase (DIM6/NTAB) family NADH-FMN oxidoreductase RutF
MWEETLAPRRSKLDPRDFRAALGCFATGVCLVTTLGPQDKPEGLTINSFSSVSLDPPMVLWSLARSASSAPVFRDAEYFAVNVLARDDDAISTHFARSAQDKFADFAERFTPGTGGAPLLKGAAATFECHSRHRYYGGDHIILIGNVERYVWNQAAPLLYHRGKYGLSA